MKDIVQQRMDRYPRLSAEDEENALKEVAQEIALFGLYKAGFFSHARFEGGTALRIIYGLDRFSEDLDFSLLKPNPHFDLVPFLYDAGKIMGNFGFKVEVQGEARERAPVHKGFLKDDGIKKIIIFKHHQNPKKKIKIKIEADTNPPDGAEQVQKYLDFPLDFVAVSADLSTLLAGKCHALLCRPYVKGRDWYDFSWFVARGVQPNYRFLANALHQMGPWQGHKLEMDGAWLRRALETKIDTIDWRAAQNDVKRFLSPQRQESILLWSCPFFRSKVARLI